MFGMDGFYAIMVRSKERGVSSNVTSRYVGVGGQNGNFSVTLFLNDPVGEFDTDKKLHGLEMTILGQLSDQTIKNKSHECFCVCNVNFLQSKLITELFKTLHLHR